MSREGAAGCPTAAAPGPEELPNLMFGCECCLVANLNCVTGRRGRNVLLRIRMVGGRFCIRPRHRLREMQRKYDHVHEQPGNQVSQNP